MVPRHPSTGLETWRGCDDCWEDDIQGPKKAWKNRAGRLFRFRDKFSCAAQQKL
jgi:hypothetical protein